MYYFRLVSAGADLVVSILTFFLLRYEFESCKYQVPRQIETDNGIFRLSTCYMRLGNSLLAFLHISKASIGLPIYVYRIGPCGAQG